MVQQLKDMAATVTFLGLNQVASGSVIYDGMTLKELAESTYTELLAFASAVKADRVPEVPLKLKEKLGTLMTTKEMNPALFISPLFLFGIYMPVFAPFVVPLILTATGIVKLKVGSIFKGSKDGEDGDGKDGKQKTD